MVINMSQLLQNSCDQQILNSQRSQSDKSGDIIIEETSIINDSLC